MFVIVVASFQIPNPNVSYTYGTDPFNHFITILRTSFSLVARLAILSLVALFFALLEYLLFFGIYSFSYSLVNRVLKSGVIDSHDGEESRCDSPPSVERSLDHWYRDIDDYVIIARILSRLASRQLIPLGV